MNPPDMDAEPKEFRQPIENSGNLTHGATKEPPSLRDLFDDLLVQELQTIPERLAFRIGEVSELVGVKPYVVRYWQSEFEVLRPKKADNKQRLFTKPDVEMVFLIRKLLHRDRYSIEGARAAIKSAGRKGRKALSVLVPSKPVDVKERQKELEMATVPWRKAVLKWVNELRSLQKELEKPLSLMSTHKD